MGHCKPHSLSAEQAAEIVRTDLAACHVAGSSSRPMRDVRWSEEKVRESLTVLKACLVAPYTQRFCLKDTAAEMKAAPPVIAVYWVIAKSQQLLEYYDSELGEYGLALEGQGGTLPETVGVRGDLIGVFGAM
jgi:hypothetical protein